MKKEMRSETMTWERLLEILDKCRSFAKIVGLIAVVAVVALALKYFFPNAFSSTLLPIIMVLLASSSGAIIAMTILFWMVSRDPAHSISKNLPVVFWVMFGVGILFIVKNVRALWQFFLWYTAQETAGATVLKITILVLFLAAGALLA